MDKKDVANIRKQFKPDNPKLKIHDLFHVYVMKESSDIYHQEYRSFSMLEREEQELFFKNFKKVLTGQMDVKLFELRFQPGERDDHSRHILYRGLRAETADEWQEEMLLLVEKMFKEVQYDTDMVVTFIRGEYRKPVKQKEEDGDPDDGGEAHYSFILCSLNKTEMPDKVLAFDYVEKEFKAQFAVNPVINLTAPAGGFLFPAISGEHSDVNHVLYSAGKANEPDEYFIEEVLNGETVLTAKEDKAVFEEIVKDVIGEQVKSSTLANVYEEINRMITENEEETVPTLDYKDVERVLKASGAEDVSREKVEMAFQRVVDDEHYELKAENILPKYTAKSIKMETKVAKISISPQDLKYVRQVVFNGKRYLMIEIDEDAEVEGFKLIPEAF